MAHVAGVEEVWTRDGWVDRFGLDLPRHDTGYGHGPDEVAKVRAPADLLSGYYHAVHKFTLEYVAGVTADELARVVDTNWDPPVTASARLVSIIDDCAQHLGQAAYLRGIARRLARRAVRGGSGVVAGRHRRAGAGGPGGVDAAQHRRRGRLRRDGPEGRG